MALSLGHHLVVGAAMQLAFERLRSELAILEAGLARLDARPAVDQGNFGGRIPEAEERNSPGLDDRDFARPRLLGHALFRFHWVRSHGVSLP